MGILADRIRHHLTPPGHFPGQGPTAALLAVVDQCERMRTPVALTTEADWKAADRIESVIARELGITTEETSC